VEKWTLSWSARQKKAIWEIWVAACVEDFSCICIALITDSNEKFLWKIFCCPMCDHDCIVYKT
jgi:hypothetical protein